MSSKSDLSLPNVKYKGHKKMTQNGWPRNDPSKGCMYNPWTKARIHPSILCLMIRYIKELLHSLLKILRIFPCKFQGFLYQSNSSTRYDVTQMSSSSTISCWRRHDSCISSAFRKHSTLTRDLPMFRLLNRDRPLFFLLLRLVSFYTNNPIKGRSPKKKR